MRCRIYGNVHDTVSYCIYWYVCNVNQYGTISGASTAIISYLLSRQTAWPCMMAYDTLSIRRYQTHTKLGSSGLASNIISSRPFPFFSLHINFITTQNANHFYPITLPNHIFDHVACTPQLLQLPIHFLQPRDHQRQGH